MSEKTASWFRTRRLGHVNLYISEYERSLEFYRSVVGLHGGWTRPKIGGAFLNNGASHHDVGFLPWNSAERRVAVSGPGLNHLAFDVGTEADLAAGYRAALDARFAFIASADHVVSKSLYCAAPNGMQIEIYADTHIPFTDPDFLAMRRATTNWDVSKVSAPDETPHYVQEHRPKASPDTIFQASRVDGATIIVDDIAETLGFFELTLGLRATLGGAAGGFALLQGALGGRDLVLLQRSGDEAAGLHHFSFLALSESGLEESLAKCRSRGVEIESELDLPVQRAVFLRDPDGHLVKIFVDRVPAIRTTREASARSTALWLL